jgi:hypothetical protein
MTDDTDDIRDNTGRFRKGHSGNPTGRRTDKGDQDVKALARECTGEAIETLREIMRNTSASSAARVSAATALLDRGHGKPAQTVNATFENKTFQQMSDEELHAIARGDPEGDEVMPEQIALLASIGKRGVQ